MCVRKILYALLALAVSFAVVFIFVEVQFHADNKIQSGRKRASSTSIGRGELKVSEGIQKLNFVREEARVTNSDFSNVIGHLPAPSSKPESKVPFCCELMKTGRYPSFTKFHIPGGRLNGFILHLWSEEDIVSHFIKTYPCSLEPQKDFFIIKLLKAAQHAARHRWEIDAVGFVDIGANVGYFTFLAASHQISVLAVEAWDQNMFLIDQTIKSNSPYFNKIFPVQRAACAAVRNGGNPGARGCIKATSMENIGNGKMAQANLERRKFSDCVDTPRFATLDSIIENVDEGSWQNRSIVIMKIDTEGFEAHALLGAGSFLANPVIKPCVIFVEQWKGRSEYGDLKICEVLMEAGYKLFRECCQAKEERHLCLVHPAIESASDCVNFALPNGQWVTNYTEVLVEYVAIWKPSSSDEQERPECQATTKEVHEWVDSSLTCQMIEDACREMKF